jgi:two-component system response regulator GlrR
MEKILVVDDDETILKLISMRLEVEGYSVSVAADARKAMELAVGNFFHVALLDFRLAGKDGVTLMEDLLKLDPELPVIILTAYGTVKGAVEAMKKGAYGYLTKPFEYDDLLLQIQHCSEKRGLSEEVKRLKNLVTEQYGFDHIIGKSGVMKRVLEQVARAAQVDTSVFISGESGTGKELIAKSLHVASSRKNGPFVAINCAAIPENLFESELFGFEKGAFTGAQQSRKGLLAQADGGTFLMDEISEMHPNMQAKLLRAIEEMAFYPLGSDKQVKVNFRLVAASNKNLEELVQNGRFREDLFYRIHIIHIKLPPLRERKEDIPLLTKFFLKKCTERINKEVTGFSSGALRKLMSHDWPGNVRELENAIESAVAMVPGTIITEDLMLPGRGPDKKTVEPGGLKSYKDAKNEFEKQYLIQLIETTGGNITDAAKLAGKQRADLYQSLRKHGLDPRSFRKPYSQN